MYNLDCEPGHRELFEEVVHVDLTDYQPGAAHYERLQEQLEMNRRFSWPSEGYEVNL